MRVSCVIPTHGRPALLAEALDSVAAQTRRPDEVLVVDDVADPGTASVVQRFRDTSGLPLRHLTNPFGSGASSSRNAGAAAATGDALAFLDDDDRWRPRYLEAALGALERGGVLVVFTHIQVLLDGAPTEAFTAPAGLRAADVLARNPGVTGSNVVLQAEAFRRVGGFDETLWVSNDKDFLYRLLDAGLRYALVPELLVEQRRHRGPRLTTDGLRHAAGLRRYYEKHASQLSAAERRFLRFQIERSLRRATRGARRLRHSVRLLPLLRAPELAELLGSARERVGRP